jgi:long-chain acyl-CoA synthetase
MTDQWTHIYDLLDSSCERFGDKALFKSANGKEISYDEARSRSVDLAKGLILSGLRAGDNIAIASDRSSAEWCLCYLAILRMGAVVVPLDPGLKSEELKSMLADCEASAVICSTTLIETFKNVRIEVPSIDALLATDSSGSYGVPDVADLIEKGTGKDIRFPERDPENIAVLIYTSGTTGNPKGVMLSEANIVSDIEAVHQTLTFVPQDTFLSVLPLHHTFECSCGFLCPMSKGCRIVFARSYKSGELLEDIRINRVTIMCGVPLMYEKMWLTFKRRIARSGAVSRVLFKILFAVSYYGFARNHYWGIRLFRSLRVRAGMDSVRLFVSGGAALPPTVGRFFNVLGIPLVQGYGLSETSPVLSVTPVEKNVVESIGPPLTGVDMRIDDPDDQGLGEIVVRGPMVMLGYYQNEEATSQVIQGGWFFTGDVGKADEQNYFYITGRSRNIIVSAAGKNIYPEEIESLLDQSPFILESIVLGSKTQGSNAEEVTAVVVPDMEYFDSMEQQQDADHPIDLALALAGEVRTVSARLAEFKRIKRHYVRMQPLPRTTSRKLKRSIEIDDDGELVERRRV